VVNAAYARVRDDIVRLVHGGLPVPEFSRAVGEALSRAVPAEGTCLMIAAAYGLTDRERQVTELVAQGLSTRQVAGRLYASAYTVQDHLKSGTGSRGDLIAKLSSITTPPH
jgi:DNA-binding CsgD family transcriptional regulator